MRSTNVVCQAALGSRQGTGSWVDVQLPGAVNATAFRIAWDLFRAKLIDELWKAYRSSSFDGFRDFDDPQGFSFLMRRLPKEWIVYAKESFDRGEHVRQYLGRYTHRAGIANSRLVDVGDDFVTFRTKDGKTTTIDPVEFLRRFVRHVLPDGFHKIRPCRTQPFRRQTHRCSRNTHNTPHSLAEAVHSGPNASHSASNAPDSRRDASAATKRLPQRVNMPSRRCAGRS